MADKIERMIKWKRLSCNKEELKLIYSRRSIGDGISEFHVRDKVVLTDWKGFSREFEDQLSHDGMRPYTI